MAGLLSQNMKGVALKRFKQDPTLPENPSKNKRRVVHVTSLLYHVSIKIRTIMYMYIRKIQYFLRHLALRIYIYYCIIILFLLRHRKISRKILTYQDQLCLTWKTHERLSRSSHPIIWWCMVDILESSYPGCVCKR